MDILLQRLKNTPAAVVALALGIVVQASIVYAYSLTRIYNFEISVSDSGSYLQALQAILAYGKPLSTLQPMSSEQHWFGFHFTPLLYALAPFYALWPAPEMLETVHAAALSLAAIPVYLSARSLVLSRRVACVGAYAYLFNPITLIGSFWGFHESSLAVLWVSIALWSLVTRRFKWLVASSVLLVLTKEHYGLSVFIFGLMWWRLHNDKRKGLTLAIAGLVSLATVMLVLMP